MPTISNDYCITKGLCFLISIPYSLIHLLRLVQLALSLIEVAQVIDDMECECMLGVPCFLNTGRPTTFASGATSTITKTVELIGTTKGLKLEGDPQSPLPLILIFVVNVLDEYRRQ